MSYKDPIVNGIEKVLSFLPDKLTEEEKQKIDEIKEILDNIENKRAE